MSPPPSAYRTHPWVIGQIAPDFRLLDVWPLSIQGGRDDFSDVLETMASFDPTEARSMAWDAQSLVSGALFWLRFRVGELFGWDVAKKRPIPGCTETTLSARLPANLRHSAKRPLIRAMRRAGGGFVPLYRTDDEWAAEVSNDTVHGVLHVAWVEQGRGRYRAHMGVYVKPRGWLGEVYMLIIQPLRHRIVYPALIRQIGRAWDVRHLAPLDITRSRA